MGLPRRKRAFTLLPNFRIPVEFYRLKLRPAYRFSCYVLYNIYVPRHSHTCLASHMQAHGSHIQASPLTCRHTDLTYVPRHSHAGTRISHTCQASHMQAHGSHIHALPLTCRHTDLTYMPRLSHAGTWTCSCLSV